MSILLLGAVTNDTLVFPKQNWQTKNSLGGILYTVNALTYLTKETIIPICNIGYDIFDDVVGFLNRFNNISLEGLTKVNYPNIQCNIIYVNEYGIQYDIGKEIPIKYSQISKYLKICKFIIASSMTGFDINLSTLKKIKNKSICPIYFDYHILALGRDKLGNRYLQRKKNWFDWCTNCDYLQLNKFEAELLNGSQINTKNDMLRFSKPIIKAGVKLIIVTLGRNGVFVCLPEDTKIRFLKLEPITVKEIDATGCGDTFASAFVASFLKSNNIVFSLENANKIAGLKSSFHGFEKMEEIVHNL